MSNRIYKYVGHSYLDKVFKPEDNVTLKCSYPKDFNDPYELFLTINYNERPEVLAFYADAVGELPQLPITCFSRSPAVIPMWAHYAETLQGFCIEFDEQLLGQFFPESAFGDVDYEDTPSAGLADTLYRAYEIGKPRYIHFLRKGVFSAAYYTKATCWNYEQERRMIVKESETRLIDELILMDVPKECITGLIVGPRASAVTIRAIREVAKQIGCRHFQLKIGRTSPNPFFVDEDGKSFIFSGTEIEFSSQFCSTCKEPISNESKQCSWCRIKEVHKEDAAMRNPYRMLAHCGLLESYIESVQVIDRRIRNSED
ncbi:MAG: DUF2971 domain-containing protein [Desulfuromonadaceae bacterium]|nr:DUF2971 domain-containing protein [Desulfuromonadaceae bacterium]MDD2848513.1 DUF2971 domain-containing protein [Desulfuromonadaceae bacterium]MDD4129858.1 DUF2971 domain-containing protein [Desulfuromonadaceae bacterium]